MNTVRMLEAGEYQSLAGGFDLHFLQSPEWGAFKARHGWQPGLLGVFAADGSCLALGQFLKRPVFAGTSFAYFAKGPACDYTRADLVETVIRDINAFLRATDHSLVFVRYEMDLVEARDGVVITPDPAAIFTATGCRKSPSDVQYRDTRKLPLGSESATWDGFSSKQRNKIKVAGKKEVLIERRSDVAVLDEFFAVYSETAGRNNIFIHPLAYYQDFFATFVQAGMAEFYGAWYQGRMLSGAFIVHYGKESIYMYSGSSDFERNRRPNEAIQWEAIREAIRRGATVYDFWGVAPWGVEDHPWAGLSEFKAGFGGEHLRYVGCYDYPCKRLAYGALVLVEQGRKALLQLHKRLRGKAPRLAGGNEAPVSGDQQKAVDPD